MQPEYQPSPTLRRITSERQQRAISPVPDYRISIPTPTSRTRRSCFAIPKPILKWLLLCLVISTVLAYIGYALYFNNESISFEEAVLNLKLTPPVAYSDVHLDPKFNSTWDFGRKYGIVIDAGSSGSRAQVYSWKLDPSSSRLINIEKSHSDGEDFQLKTHPGLSSFKPATVGGHIRPLLDFAAKTIPKEKLKQSSVYLFATAGMRMLPVSDQDALLNAICALVRNEYEYQTLGGCNNHFRVITGNLEGIFGWLTVNYLQHAWKDPDPDAPSYGFLDMGGASAQIAFEPTPAMRLLHADDLTSLRLKFQSGRQMQLAVFVSSFLGYGANEALKAYILALTQGAGSAKVIDPCLPIGYSTTEHNVSLNGSGSFEKCYLGITPLLKKDKECKELPCLFDGVHAPLSDIQNHHFIGVSEFWYTTFDIFHLGGPYRYDILRDAAKTYCASTWENVTSRYNANEFSNIENVSRLHEQCFKVSYIMNILHEGLGMQNDAHASGKPTFETVQNIRRFDVSWTLGAIFMLASSAILDTEQPAFSVLPITVVICVNLAIAACIIFRKRLRKGMLDMGYFHRETPYQLLPLPTVRPSKFKALE